MQTDTFEFACNTIQLEAMLTANTNGTDTRLEHM